MPYPTPLRSDVDRDPRPPRKADLMPLGIIARWVAARDGDAVAGAVIERDFVMLEPARPPRRFRRRRL